MGGEVVVFAMLKDKQSVFFQESVLEDEVGEGGKLGQRIGRIGEDEVELLVTALQEMEDISFYQHMFFRADFLHALTDEAGMVAVFFDAHHLRTAP